MSLYYLEPREELDQFIIDVGRELVFYDYDRLAEHEMNKNNWSEQDFMEWVSFNYPPNIALIRGVVRTF